MRILALLLSLMLAASTCNAHEPDDYLPRLNKMQTAQADAFLLGIYNISALEGPFPPYVCLSSVFWDDWWIPFEFGLKHYLYHIPQRGKKAEPFQFTMWKVFLDVHGCGDWDYLRKYHPHD